MSMLSQRFESDARAVLARHPNVTHEWRNQSKRAEAVLAFPTIEDDGFELVLSADATEIHVQAEGARVTFCALNPEQVASAVEEVLGLTRDLLSPGMRLRTQHAGGRAYKWLLERAT